MPLLIRISSLRTAITRVVLWLGPVLLIQLQPLGGHHWDGWNGHHWDGWHGGNWHVETGTAGNWHDGRGPRFGDRPRRS